jgi:dipeptidyl aminopeptidase/acylaminoacyl peptidase
MLQVRRTVLALLLPAALAAQQGDGARVIAPGENLITQGIPPIPAAVAAAAARYGEVRSASLWDWHPTRHEILIGTRFADAVQLHRVRQPMGARTQLTFYPDPVAAARYEPTRGDYVVFMKDVGGGEFYQLYRYDLATGDVTLLTDGSSRNLLGEFSHRGDRLAYTSTRRTGNDTDIWLIDPRDKSTDRLLAQVRGGGWDVLDWSPDDRTILVGEGISVNESYLWLLDVASGAMTPLIGRTPGGEKVAYSAGRFSKDGRGVYVATDRGSEFQRLAYVDLATKQHTALTPRLNWDVDELALSDDGRLLAFVTNEDGRSALHVMDTRTRAERRLPALPPGVIFGLRWHKDSRTLGVALNSARSPSDVYAVDVPTGRLTRWTESETGGLPASAFAEPELVHWTTFDGRTLSGFLYKPPPRFTGRRPVIVSIHGGPEGQSRPVFLGRNNYYLNELGVAILYPNVRGSTGYGKTFVALDNGVRREGSYKDIGALLDWIGARPDLDATRVMVTGGSYGGHMTLVVATRYNDKICCSVDVVGISNLATFLQNTSGYRRDLRRAEYGDERDSTVRAFMERTAPLNVASNITKPLFVVQGKNDPRVPISEAEQMVATVRKNGTPVWYLVATDEGHGFQKKRNVDFQFYSTIRFVQEFLLPEGARP